MREDSARRPPFKAPSLFFWIMFLWLDAATCQQSIDVVSPGLRRPSNTKFKFHVLSRNPRFSIVIVFAVIPRDRLPLVVDEPDIVPRDLRVSAADAPPRDPQLFVVDGSDISPRHIRLSASRLWFRVPCPPICQWLALCFNSMLHDPMGHRIEYHMKGFRASGQDGFVVNPTHISSE